MRAIILAIGLASFAHACPNIAPCFEISAVNEELMEHGYLAPDEFFGTPSLLELIRPMIGIPYRFGGEDDSGIDCSAFSRVLYKKLGVSLPRTSRSQYSDHRFTEVSMEHLQEWDLLFFKKAPHLQISHVAVYVGNGKIAHSSRKEGGVTISNFGPGSYWSDIAYAAKRLREEY